MSFEKAIWVSCMKRVIAAWRAFRARLARLGALTDSDEAIAGEVPAAPLQSAPERPIESRSQDQLDRSRFIRRLSHALVNPQTGRSTGVIVGITGPWGSGKSSVLHLLRAELREAYADALVVNFDPWLVSGRNALISDFFTELIGTINADEARSRRFKSFAAAASRYAAQLSPAGDFAAPGVGSVLSGMFLALGNFFSRAKSLDKLRTQLVRELQNTRAPVVVLIDEIDRVEDEEVRAIAQLVRSVADFPGISYLLAYDTERVIQALGSGTDNERKERGRAYLEKIVQLQVPLPLVLDEEIRRLLIAGLRILATDLEMPDNFERIERLSDLLNNQVGITIATPRDVRRLVGAFHVLGGMLRDEVDWIDLLAYTILMIKAPATIALMYRNPEDYLTDRQTPRGVSRGLIAGEPTGIDQLIALEERTEPIRDLLRFLLPALDGESTDSYSPPNAFRRRRAMLSTLRLGLLPGAYSREQVVELFASSPEEVADQLRAAYANERLGDLTERVDELYGELSGDRQNFWRGAAKFARKPDCPWLSSYQPMNQALRSLVEILESAIQRRAASRDDANVIFGDLRVCADEELVSYLIRSHIFAHGLFGRRRSESRAWFLAEEQTRSVAEEMSQLWRAQHLSGQLIPCRWDLQAVYTMIDTGIWDDECRGAMNASLTQDQAVDGLALLLNGGPYSTDPSTVEIICSRDLFLRRVAERISATGASVPHETALVALRKTAGDRF